VDQTAAASVIGTDSTTDSALNIPVGLALIDAKAAAALLRL
jgi:hypothetical protein